MTPITETRTIDRWLHVRNFESEDSSVGEQISDQFRIAFAEDKEILQAVQEEETRHEVVSKSASIWTICRPVSLEDQPASASGNLSAGG